MSIPIIGQPKIKDWHVTILIECTCGGHLMLVAQLGNAGPCPVCNRVYRFDGMSVKQGDTSASIFISGVTGVQRTQG